MCWCGGLIGSSLSASLEADGGEARVENFRTISATLQVMKRKKYKIIH
jgi:hypothetical protein